MILITSPKKGKGEKNPAEETNDGKTSKKKTYYKDFLANEKIAMNEV